MLVKQLMKRLVPSFIVLILVIVSFMQMIYLVQRRTLGYDSNCLQDDQQNEDVAVCSIWGACFQMTYFVMMGDRVLDRPREDGEEKSKAIMIGISLVFVVVVGLLLLQIIGTSIITTSSYGSNNVMLDNYWVPMMTFVLLFQSFDGFLCNRNEKLLSNDPFERQAESRGRYHSDAQCCSSLESKFHFTWEYLWASYFKSNMNETLWWYERRSSVSKVLCSLAFT